MIQVGLLVFPCKLYRVTDDDDYKFRQVHAADGGRIQYTRRCSVCEKPVDWNDLGKGKEAGGQMIVLTDEELDSLPLAGAKVVDVDRFISLAEVPLSGFGKSYFIEPEMAGIRPYTLLRQGLKAAQRVGVAKFAMRTKDSIAIIRPEGQMLVLQQLAWPEQIREPEFRFMREEVKVTEMERQLAGQLIETMSDRWEPGKYTSEYAAAIDRIVQARLAGQEPPPTTPAKQRASEDIGAVLRASVDAAKKRQKAAA